jgi:hypothetical protein
MQAMTSIQTEADPVLLAIELFLEASGMTATAFGVRALNDPTLVHEMRNGRECKRTTRARILEFIEAEKAKASGSQSKTVKRSQDAA